MIVILKPNPGEKIYEAAYKKRKSGRLLWVQVSDKESKSADKRMDAFVQEQYPNKGYRRYAGALEKKD